MITVKAFANNDDILLAWQPAPFPEEWVGFQIERRDELTQQVTLLPNRIPPQPGEKPVDKDGISSSLSPIRRCLWTDHSVVGADKISYRITPMTEGADGTFTAVAAAASEWTTPLTASADAGDGLSACFNRGTLMSQVVSRFVNGDVSDASIRKFLQDLSTPAFPARRYLSGDALPAIISFLHDADQRGSTIHLAIYEINDHQLVDALKPFRARGHVLLGNGGATEPWVAQELTAAGLEIRHRDLSHSGKSSPSVHNKFLVESDAGGTALRVLTGSTNWTTTGLCTQLNNVLVLQRPVIAARFLDQWGKLVAAGDDMTPALVQSNKTPTTDKEVSLFFAATKDQPEFTAVRALIAGAKQGALFLMFTPGQSPLLSDLLDRAQTNDIYVRGVVSSINPPKSEGQMGSVEGAVVKSGSPKESFHRDVILPGGISEKNQPSFQETEFTVKEMQAAHMIAIVHSKVIVIDPFSPDCAVVTGSHNFSPSAADNNDENLIIIRGNQPLAQAYALHINGVYDHYSWRAFLHSGGNAGQIFKPLDGWRPGGARAQELSFWMGGPAAGPGSSKSAKKKASPSAASAGKSTATKKPKKSATSTAAKKAPPAKASKSPVKKKAVSAKATTKVASKPQATAKPKTTAAKSKKAPVKKKAAPAKPSKAPVKKKAAPAKPSKAPVKKKAAPAKPSKAPVKKKAAPAKSKKAPVKKKAAPAKSSKAPVKKKAATPKSKKAPTKSKPKPPVK
ncbi:phospholipase D-like domain-containing protein [Prosthecobacter sp.]|uniref:phospholipase D-like domain-containing protein n=1 Tax=Prosthecobacter sp. TaxID=1965333 RepID=UPI003784496E